MSVTQAIGVFDSGLGGLTVLKTLQAHFPTENFVYLGDTARIPYGTKSPDTVRRYLNQNINFLLSQEVKAIVIACNSASSVADGVDCPVPVYDVIRPGARLAAATTKNRKVGVIGTRTTVKSEAYVRAIHDLNPQIEVYQQACPLLIPLVEEGLIDDPITNLIAYRYLSPLIQAGVDTLILGCTHFPVLRAAIQKVVGKGVVLVDSAESICEDLTRDFQTEKLTPGNSERIATRFLSTDVSDHQQHLARLIMAPQDAGPFEALDITNFKKEN